MLKLGGDTILAPVHISALRRPEGDRFLVYRHKLSFETLKLRERDHTRRHAHHDSSTRGALDSYGISRR